MQMNISSILEYKRALHMALVFTYMDFIYNPELFTKFLEEGPGKELIDPTNELIFAKNPKPLISMDYSKYIVQLKTEINSFKEFMVKKPESLLQLKQDILDKDISVIIPNDHYYLYNEFRKITNDMLHYHSGIHSSTLVDIDFDSRKCYLIDKFFSFAGEVTLESYNNACDSDYIDKETKAYIKCIEIINNNNLSQVDGTREYLKRNIKQTLKDEVTIDNRHYYKNIKALEMFLKDFDYIIAELLRHKDKYAPQFFTNMLQLQRLQRLSYKNLISYLNQFLNNKVLQELQSNLDEITKQWYLIDALCDKCYLSGRNLDAYSSKMFNIFNSICENEKIVLDKLCDLADKL